MYTALSILLTVMAFFGNWFGFADEIVFNPAKVEFNSPNLIKEAEITASENKLLLPFLTDCSSLTECSFKQEGSFVEINFNKPTEFNTVVLRENTDNVELFKIYVMKNGEYVCVYEQDRIMTYRLCDLDETVTDKIKIEFTEIRDKVSIGGIEIYNENRTDKNFRVSDYMTFAPYSLPILDTDYFKDYFDVVTDLIVFQTVSLDEKGNISLDMEENEFESCLNKVKTAIGERDVNLWCTVLFQLYSGDANYDDNDYRRDFINNNIDTITENLKAFAEKYGFDGIDFDWEHPTTKEQFKAYDKLIIETAKFTKVSVAGITWSFRFSKAAIEKIDHFNVMTYDLFDERGNHSNIYDCGRSAIEKFIGYGVPKEKIFLGIPSYCRPIDKGAYWGSYNSHPELGKFGNKIENETYYAGSEEITQDVYFNSYTDFRDKTALSLQYGIGGVMVFNLHSDLPMSVENSLHRAIYDAGR